jgi:hypothetical protein
VQVPDGINETARASIIFTPIVNMLAVWIIGILFILFLLTKDTGSLPVATAATITASKSNRLDVSSYDWGKIPVSPNLEGIIVLVIHALEEYEQSVNISPGKVQNIIDTYIIPAHNRVSERLPLDSTDFVLDACELRVGDLYTSLQKCLGDDLPMDLFKTVNNGRFWELVFMTCKYKQQMFTCSIMALFREMETSKVFKGIEKIAVDTFPDNQEKQRLYLMAILVKYHKYIRILEKNNCEAMETLKQMETELPEKALVSYLYEANADVVFPYDETVTNHNDPFWIDWIQRCLGKKYSPGKAIVQSWCTFL